MAHANSLANRRVGIEHEDDRARRIRVSQSLRRQTLHRPRVRLAVPGQPNGEPVGASLQGSAERRLHGRHEQPQGGHHEGPWSELTQIDTSIADYVWLPFRFERERALLDWHDDWRIEDYT